MRTVIRYCLLLTATAVSAWGGTVNFSGVFGSDDAVQLFTYTVQNGGQVTVSTTSYATGGFSPILSLFDSTGQFLFDDAGYNNSPESDAMLQWVSAGGAQYVIALTEYDNFPVASGDNGNLSEGFTEAGNGNFTAAPPFNNYLTGGFYDGPGGAQRTADWALTISAPSGAGPLTATQLPEPASFVLTLAGAALLLVRKRISTRS